MDDVMPVVTPSGKSVRGRHASIRSGPGRCVSFGTRVAGDSAELPLPDQVPARPTTGEGGQYDPRAGFRAITTSIAFRWGTPPELEMNSTCPESTICQSQ